MSSKKKKKCKTKINNKVEVKCIELKKRTVRGMRAR